MCKYTLKTSVVFLDMFVTVETVKATAKMTRQLTFLLIRALAEPF